MIIVVLYALFLVILIPVFSSQKKKKRHIKNTQSKISADRRILFSCSLGCMVFGILVLLFDFGDLTRYINGISLIGFGCSIMAMEFSSSDSDSQKEVLNKILKEVKSK